MNIKQTLGLLFLITSFNITTQCAFPFSGTMLITTEGENIHFECKSFSGKLEVDQEDMDKLLFEVGNAEVTTYPALFPVIQIINAPDTPSRYHINFTNMRNWALAGIASTAALSVITYLALQRVFYISHNLFEELTRNAGLIPVKN